MRRALLLAGALAPVTSASGATVEFPPVVPAQLVFPRDHGAHPDYRIEWWYLTGALQDHATDAPLGIQVTFFRIRTAIDPANPSRFAAHQILFAHAALAEPERARLLVDQQIARAGSGAVRIDDADTNLLLNRWHLSRAPGGAYECRIPSREFDLRLVATPSQPALLQGRGGFSRKQAQGDYASQYYSMPQLRIEAELRHDNRRRNARGVAWLDHEWASALLAPDAAGWDWIGMNLDDGTALTAFQIRRKGDNAPAFTYASIRSAGETDARILAPEQVRFEALEYWQSPRTRARYPIAQRITVGDRVVETRPWLSDQELDTRLTGSAIYWEGASWLVEDGRRIGRGYLELTGYAAPLVL